MAGAKRSKSILLSIVLGVPVFWYLFLQFFGTNEFELPVIAQLPKECAPSELSIILLREPKTTNESNQLSRIKQNTFTSSLIRENTIFEQDCDFGASNVVFVDDIGQVYGQYDFNLEDIDRLITEAELFYTIRAKHATGN